MTETPNTANDPSIATMDVDALKSKGNAMFCAGKYAEAVELYSQAIDLAPEKAVLYSNRSVAYHGLMDYEKALQDGRKCVELKPEWEKGHFRTANALEYLDKPEEARTAYWKALEICPSNPEIRRKVNNLDKLIESRNPPPKEEPKTQNSKKNTANGKKHVEMPPVSAWARSMSQDKQYEWLVDCYRMRIDDDYAWGGCNFHGRYDPDATTSIVVGDFFVFCKLAVQKGALPMNWKWDKFLDVALRLLPYGFEKSDAQEKYGSENVFSALHGGSSLRYTGEMIYGRSVMAGDEDPDDLIELNELVKDEPWPSLICQTERFNDIGGSALWSRLHSQLKIE